MFAQARLRNEQIASAEARRGEHRYRKARGARSALRIRGMPSVDSGVRMAAISHARARQENRRRLGSTAPKKESKSELGWNRGRPNATSGSGRSSSRQSLGTGSISPA